MEKVLQRNENRKCIFCHNIAVFFCQKCDGLYCSKKCQIVDWPKHRYICFKMPCLVKISDTPTNEHVLQSKPKLFKHNASECLKSEQQVVITFAERNNILFIRSKESEDDTQYSQILINSMQAAKKSKNLTAIPKIDDYVLAHDGTAWYRARVLNIANFEKVTIAYIDFGNCELKKFTDLKELPQQFWDLKCFTFSVFLKDVTELPINHEFQLYINNFVENVIPLKVIYNRGEKKNNKLVVQLYDLETNENLNKKFKETLSESSTLKLAKSHTQKLNKSTTQEILWFKDIKQRYLPYAENIAAKIVDTSAINNGVISLIPISFDSELQELEKLFEVYANDKLQPYLPKKNEMCIAKCNGKWLRAYGYDILNDVNPELYFIDSGKYERISVYNIKKYPLGEIFDLPCYYQDYLISSLEHLLDDERVNIPLHISLKKLLPLQTEIIVHKVEKINDIVNVVHIPKIIKILHDKGLIN